MDISVVITAYNIEEYIGECLESVQKQDFEELEIICVDDCSTDGTVNVIKKYSEDDHRIRLIERKTNGGPAAAMNTGIRIAKGKYLYLMDGDDYLKEGMFKKLYSVSENNQLDVLSFSGSAFIDKSISREKEDSFNVISYQRKACFEGVFTGPELFAAYIKENDNIGNLCLQFIRREIYVNNELYANDYLRYANDSPFGIYMYAKRAMCIPDVYYMRRYRSGSCITGGRSFLKAECIMLQVASDLHLYQVMDISEELSKIIDYYFLKGFRSVRYMLQGVDMMDRRYQVLQHYPAVRLMFEHFIIRDTLYPAIDDDLCRRLSVTNDILLYGTGFIAYDIAELLEKRGVHNYTPVVSKKKGESIFRNRKVYSIDQIRVDWSKTMVLVATSKKYHQEIHEILDKYKPLETIMIE